MQGEGDHPSLKRAEAGAERAERSGGLHKRSAEDWGKPFAPRDRAEPLSEGLVSLFVRVSAHEFSGSGVAGQEQAAEILSGFSSVSFFFRGVRGDISLFKVGLAGRVPIRGIALSAFRSILEMRDEAIVPIRRDHDADRGVLSLLELFDRWDAPGFSNDTEFKVYAFLFAICLVLLLCKLISSGALRLGFVSWRVFCVTRE